MVRLRQVRHEAVAAGTGHPRVRVLVEKPFLFHEPEVRFAILSDHRHDGVEQGGVVIDPGEQVVVADQLEQVHGKAAVEIAQPGTIARVGIEMIVAAKTHGQDVAEDVLQEILLMKTFPPIHAAGAHMELARVMFRLHAKVEGVAQIAAAGGDGMVRLDRHTVVGNLQNPGDPEIRVHDDVVPDLVGVPYDFVEGLFDVADVGVLADQLIPADVVREHAGFHEDHGPFRSQVLHRLPLPTPFGHHGIGGVLHPAAREPPQRLNFLFLDHDYAVTFSRTSR